MFLRIESMLVATRLAGRTRSAVCAQHSIKASAIPGISHCNRKEATISSKTDLRLDNWEDGHVRVKKQTWFLAKVMYIQSISFSPGSGESPSILMNSAG